MGESAPRVIVLVVDDSAETVAMLADALETHGMSALVALRGDRAARAMQAARPLPHGLRADVHMHVRTTFRAGFGTPLRMIYGPQASAEKWDAIGSGGSAAEMASRPTFLSRMGTCGGARGPRAGSKL